VTGSYASALVPRSSTGESPQVCGKRSDRAATPKQVGPLGASPRIDTLRDGPVTPALDTAPVQEAGQSSALVVRVWSESHERDGFRARISTASSRCGTSSSVRTVKIVATPDELVKAVEIWLQEFLGASSTSSVDAGCDPGQGGCRGR
jgi:hypothetical protein